MRLTRGEGGVAVEEGDLVAMRLVGGAAVIFVIADRGGDVGDALAGGLAGVARFQRGQFVGMGLDQRSTGATGCGRARRRSCGSTGRSRRPGARNGRRRRHPPHRFAGSRRRPCRRRDRYLDARAGFRARPSDRRSRSMRRVPRPRFEAKVSGVLSMSHSLQTSTDATVILPRSIIPIWRRYKICTAIWSF
jgi:hypothetical protein